MARVFWRVLYALRAYYNRFIHELSPVVFAHSQIKKSLSVGAPRGAVPSDFSDSIFFCYAKSLRFSLRLVGSHAIGKYLYLSTLKKSVNRKTKTPARLQAILVSTY